MNKRLFERCWLLSLPPDKKSVLMAMAYDAESDGGFSPDAVTLVSRTCLPREVVYEAVRWLEENGHIAAFRSPGQRTKFVAAVGPAPKRVPDFSAGFLRFWAAYPNTTRKVDKQGCWTYWHKEGLEERASQIEAHVSGMSMTHSWQSGYEPQPLRYLKRGDWTSPLPDLGPRNEARAYLAQTVRGMNGDHGNAPGSERLADGDADDLRGRVSAEVVRLHPGRDVPGVVEEVSGFWDSIQRRDHAG